MRTFETVIELISRTRTKSGLRVNAAFDSALYPTGVKITSAEMGAIDLHRNEFHGEWNYALYPRQR